MYSTHNKINNKQIPNCNTVGLIEEKKNKVVEIFGHSIDVVNFVVS